MRYVNFNPKKDLDPNDTFEGKPLLKWWTDWEERASVARENAIQDFKNYGHVEFDRTVWADLKKFFIDKVFFGKCAYCESEVDITDWGEAEHYRPKGELRQRTNGSSELVKSNGKAHPGYYWTAYDWRNLLPSCKKCNLSKMNLFPAKDHAFSPEQAADTLALDELELPDLLHPFRDKEPAKSLAFGVNGEVAALDDRGEASINTYGLKRKRLVEGRQEEQDNAFSNLLRSLAQGNTENLFSSYKSGRRRYSAAALFYLRFRLKDVKSFLSDSNATA